jgi:probable phosphoglycerate mutase
VVLVRHGETEWSRTGQHTGLTDLPLTAVGRHQAEVLRARLRAWRFTRVLSSPLQRSLETAHLAGLGHAVEVVSALSEWNYGTYEGRTTAEIRRECPGWSLWRDGAPGGEQPQEIGARVDAVLASLLDSAGDVVIFAHGHVLRVLTARWLGLAPSEGRLFALGTATLCVLGYERETPVVVRWNQDCGPDPTETALSVGTGTKEAG